MDLFTSQIKKTLSTGPLAERLRPDSLEDFLGQKRLINSKLVEQISQGLGFSNLILWGPPGTGKTTFALLVSRVAQLEFIEVNAVDTGAKKLKEIGALARDRKIQFQKPSLLFIDEIHRLNKAQQDVLLPYMEKGDLVLIGATTENPGYELNAALLSRSKVLVFDRHTKEDLKIILEKGFEKLNLKANIVLEEESCEFLLGLANGDARTLLNLVEEVAMQWSPSAKHRPLSIADLESSLSRLQLSYDKQGEEHYNCTSALIKSIRGSDPNAAVYYLARMIQSGENPIFIARRLVVLASEDIGNADPRALQMALCGLQAVELVGLPEARINLSQVVTYLASAPKSNRAYLAYNRAEAKVKKLGNLPIPKSLRSSQNKVSKDLGHGDNYKYSHSFDRGWAEQQFLPDELVNDIYYEPSQHGFEKNIQAYLDWLHGKVEKSDNKS